MKANRNKNGLPSTSFSKSKSGAGFTIIELIISTALFVTLVSISSGAFVQTLRNQRIVTRLSESMSNTTFVIEQISREIRTGFSFNVSGGSNGGDKLQFINSSGETISYKLIDSGIARCEGSSCASDNKYDALTSERVEIDNLKFIPQGVSSGDGEPPRITILISILGGNDIKVQLQTTISSRIIDT